MIDKVECTCVHNNNTNSHKEFLCLAACSFAICPNFDVNNSEQELQVDKLIFFLLTDLWWKHFSPWLIINARPFFPFQLFTQNFVSVFKNVRSVKPCSIFQLPSIWYCFLNYSTQNRTVYLPILANSSKFIFDHLFVNTYLFSLTNIKAILIL